MILSRLLRNHSCEQFISSFCRTHPLITFEQSTSALMQRLDFFSKVVTDCNHLKHLKHDFHDTKDIIIIDFFRVKGNNSYNNRKQLDLWCGNERGN